MTAKKAWASFSMDIGYIIITHLATPTYILIESIFWYFYEYLGLFRYVLICFETVLFLSIVSIRFKTPKQKIYLLDLAVARSSAASAQAACSCKLPSLNKTCPSPAPKDEQDADQRHSSSLLSLW